MTKRFLIMMANHINIDWTQQSTKRGLVWCIVALVGIPMAIAGKDVTQLLLLGAAIAGGLGVAIKD